jgi:RNA polymerase sigma factor (sigma-70 family)
MSGRLLAEIGSTELVARIVAADVDAINEFYHRFIRGLRYYLHRRGMNDTDAEDMAQETIFICIRQIQKGTMENPECLAGFVRTVATRQIFNKLSQFDRARRDANIPAQDFHRFTAQPPLDPEQQMIAAEESAVLKEALSKLKPAEVEILTRFYLNGQSRQQIESEMGLTPTQFRLQKNRAKTRLGKEGKRIAAALARQRSPVKLAA